MNKTRLVPGAACTDRHTEGFGISSQPVWRGAVQGCDSWLEMPNFGTALAGRSFMGPDTGGPPIRLPEQLYHPALSPKCFPRS